MDELAESLANSFAVSSDPNTTDAPHPRFSQYKQKSTGSDQEGRRKAILDDQKSRRFNYANHMRRLVDDRWEDTDELSDGDGEEDMEVTEKAKAFRRPGRYYQNQLMLSEWLVELPADFAEEYLMVLCPWGKRCLVISSKGYTNAYGRNGYRVNTFPSNLPGGSKKQKGNFYRDNAILDCIYHEVEKTFYVLDIMSWKDHPVYDSETDFRVFWLLSKVQEVPELAEPSKANPFKFKPLTYHPCTKESIEAAFQDTDQQIDGCLFYHKRAHYVFGRSPLVMWLKPYMLPEILRVTIPDKWIEQKPANYSTYQAHIEHIQEVREKRKEEWDKREKNKEQRKVDRKQRQKQAQVKAQQYKMDLMVSKWYLEKPDDFEEDYIAIVCPVGKRCCVMAIDGETKWFSKKAFKLPGYFLSHLPGGNLTESQEPTVTMLDCIFHEEMMTYFILDGMFWNNRDLKVMTYEDRMKLLKKEILKNSDIRYIGDLNHFKFVVLKRYECTKDGIEEALKHTTFEIDGFLFYKKSIPYTSGVTGEILWTKPFILPDIFEGLALSQKLIDAKPEGYTTFEKFVEDVQEGRDPIKAPKKKKKVKSGPFLPQRPLNLPAPPKQEEPKQGQKGKGRGRKVKQYSYYGPGTERVYGRGRATGQNYYGDGRDVYYPPNSRYLYGQGSAVGYGSTGRKLSGKKQQQMFAMGDMEAALPYLDYDPRTGRPLYRNN